MTSEKKPHPASEKIDAFAERYRLWLVIPLVIASAMALVSVRAALMMLGFLASVYPAFLASAIMTKAVAARLPTGLSETANKAVIYATFATFSLGGFAATGMILRGDNAISRQVNTWIDGGGTIAFIDPFFAAITIAAFWAYAIFRLVR